MPSPHLTPRSAKTDRTHPRSDPAPTAGPRAGARPEEVELELFTHRFASVAAEMGEMLQRTALSTNVRDRLDFSCALLNADGLLVVNAPHIPVHLGALGLCVRSVRAVIDLGPGDTVVTNHPGFGGSHLPDVTLITPVYERDVEADPGRLLGYVANRAHHAEIGGRRPGSMPPRASTLAEEGVVLEPMYLVRGGRVRWEAIRARLEAPPWPSRAVTENLADLAAALAANRRGAEALRSLARRHGADVVAHYMGALRSQAAAKMSAALARLTPGRRRAEQRLDDGTLLVADVVVADVLVGARCVLDLGASDDVHPGNLNATPAIVRGAVLYVLRLLVGEDLPLNEGLFEPVALKLRRGSLFDPDFGGLPEVAPAVVGGNVETSQRLVDTLLLAFGLAASSQGTMNNLLFGDRTFGYYETVCGGAGAGPGFDGADAVHTHMTNTRITDPEILERRYPVRLDRFAIRRGSGGQGAHRGGDGVVRELLFLRDVELSILSQHRVEAPYGVDGGADGAVGRQRIVRGPTDAASVVELAGVDQADLRAGDRLILETPGGGGWGQAP